VEPVEQVGLKESGHRHAAALDEDLLQTLRAQRPQEGDEVERTGFSARHHDFLEPFVLDPFFLGPLFLGPFLRRALHTSASAHDDRPRCSVCEDVVLRTQSRVGIEHHPNRILALHPTHRELRVVGRHGVRPDDHGVDERSQAVQAIQIFLTGHVVRSATLGGDPSVHALSELSDDDAGPGHQREVEIEHATRSIGDGNGGTPLALQVDFEHGPGVLVELHHAAQVVLRPGE